MRIAVFGPPGAGKGTIAEALVRRTGALHIATGDLLRAELTAKTELGERARSYMEKGGLVPDDLVIAMLEKRLSREDAREGFILDGFPRTIAQAERLDSLLSSRGEELEGIFDLQVEEELIIRRLSGRIICPNCEAIYNIYTLSPKIEGKCDRCGADLVRRKDDRPEAIEVRLRTYREQTEPLLGYYRPRGLLFAVDAGSGPERAADQILEVLDERQGAAKAKE
jgi:adenylate kinase